jgi:DNA helicase-2/ATP-dependent DNA helicase PcrA
MIDQAALQEINEAQRQAVTAPLGPVLVLAGAGSGKTRVLVQRLVYLVLTEQITPSAILAVTFTNKAANEMRQRIESQLRHTIHNNSSDLWLGTFHGIAHRLLRRHAEEAGLAPGFQILDSDDQARLVRRVLRGLELDERRYPPKDMQHFINRHKDEGRRPGTLNDGLDPWQRQAVRVYAAYESACKELNVVDFAELLLRTHELLQRNAALLEHYRERFRHILVDEFQDTNALQYNMLQLLAGPRGCLFLVGDDDQSIYGWRGAKVENLQRFRHDYPRAELIRLEQNYRSTATILQAANTLIRRNSGRLGKELWTDGPKGEPIRVYQAYNERDEATFVVSELGRLHAQGLPRQQMAVLYRSNAQSRLLEERLLEAGMPYRVYGGMRFFERTEVKDALAYLRLATHAADDASFERIVNVPPRGIGNQTLELIRTEARATAQPLLTTCRRLVEERALPTRAAAAVGQFVTLLDTMCHNMAQRDLGDRMALVIRDSGLEAHFATQSDERAATRLENLGELISAARTYCPPEGDPLDHFLAHAALEAGEGQGDAWEDCVQLMTLHAAKGLEFQVVFLVGLEEGLFPHQRATEGGDNLEEERRLCYVGMTRAQRLLTLTYAEHRRINGLERLMTPSRFLGEIPEELLDPVRAAPSWQRSARMRPGPVQHQPAQHPLPAGPARPTTPAKKGLHLGSQVRHPVFGEGTVTSIEGYGTEARIRVRFHQDKERWLLLRLAKLTALA